MRIVWETTAISHALYLHVISPKPSDRAILLYHLFEQRFVGKLPRASITNPKLSKHWTSILYVKFRISFDLNYCLL